MSDFTEEKLLLLSEANEKLHICDDLTNPKNKNIIFVYCPPKVGSTSLVTSFRLCALNRFTILHIHDESMLKVLCGIENVSVNDIIKYNKLLGKNVYVIDIYRSPIEQKISAFFEKVASFHFNNSEENMNKYDINKIIYRFNKIFPYLSRFDYYREVYDIPYPEKFNYEKKYILQEVNGIKYIKLRLKDSNSWQSIINEIFGVNVKIVNDYETDKKVIKTLFSRFKENYRIPANLLSSIENCDKLKYYYSPQEREEYLNTWRSKQTVSFNPFSENEYRLYMELSIENQHIGEIQRNHYMDVGCVCIGCSRKRRQILYKMSTGQTVNEVIDHNRANNEYNYIVMQKKKQQLNTLVRQVALINVINKIRVKGKPKNILKGSFGKNLK